MSHHIYTTQGFILHTKSIGEANKLVYIFTRELGLVMASAQGVRHLKSKMRYHTEQYSYAAFSLVRGKEVWRLTGAHALPRDVVGELRSHPDTYRLYVQILTLLKRLLPGEEPNEELFGCILAAVEYWVTTDIPESDMRACEDILVLRILATLGYVGTTPALTPYTEHRDWNPTLVASAALLHNDFIKVINAALKASHL